MCLRHRCIEEKCFESDSEVLADLVVFTSAPVIWDWIYNVFHAAVYSKTGRSLFGNLQLPTDGGWIPERIPALQAGNCGACFVCKVGEIRLVAFLVMSIVGCANPAYYNQFAGTHRLSFFLGCLHSLLSPCSLCTGGVEDNCKLNGAYYERLCGARSDPDLNLVSDAEWRESYPEHRNFDAEFVQGWASAAAQRAVELGGAGSPDGFALDGIAQAWFQRDEWLPVDDQSALFHRRMCQAMREARAVDGGPDYGLYERGSLARLTSEFMYESCKQAQHYSTLDLVTSNRRSSPHAHSSMFIHSSSLGDPCSTTQHAYPPQCATTRRGVRCKTLCLRPVFARATYPRASRAANAVSVRAAVPTCTSCRTLSPLWPRTSSRSTFWAKKASPARRPTAR